MNVPHQPRSEFQHELSILREAIDHLAHLEQEYTRQTAFLQQLIDLIPLGVAVHLNGRIMMINPAGATLLGAKSQEELIGMDAMALVHPDSREAARARILQLIQQPSNEVQTTVPFVRERFIRLDGSIAEAEVAGLAMAPTEAGTPILVIFKDITQDLLQRQALEESEARFRQLVDLLPDAIIIHKDERVFFVNPSAIQLMQVERAEDLVGRTIWDFLLEEEIPFIRQRIQRILTAWKPLPTAKNHIVRPNGEVFLAEVRAFPFEERGEKAILLVLQDITERERMLEQLEKSEARFRLLAESLPASVFILNEAGKLLYINRLGQSLSGFSEQDNLPPTFLQRLRVNHRPLTEKDLERLISLEMGTSVHVELQLLQENGEHRWLDIQITKTMLDEQPVGMGVALDVTLRKHMEQELKEHAQRQVMALEDERARIARELHDVVGQQIIGMKFLLETAQRHITSPDAMVAIEEVQTLLSEMTEQIRELALSLRPSMLDDLGLLSTLIWFFERFSKHTGIQVHFNHRGLEKHPMPKTHAITLYRILQEALTNVARHAQTDQVWVEIMGSSDRVFMTIQDHGRGFDPDRMAIHTSTGLQSMKERVQLLAGTWQIESSPGQGTRIDVSLPYASHLTGG